MSERYHGSCHCGAVHFSFESEAITRGLRCNCSLCTRKGAMMTPLAYAPDQFNYEADEGQLGLYQFGKKTARHFFCKTCGIYTFHETARQPGHYRANLGCIEDLDTTGFEVDVFDGKHLL